MVTMSGLVSGDANNDDGVVVDYKGSPVDKSRTGGWRGAVLIAGTELAERVCVMGISMNLVTYLVGDLHLSSARSANIVTNFMGTLNLLALLGGFVADARLGRYLTIAASTVITVLGMSLLAASTVLPGLRPPLCTPAADGGGCVAASGGQLATLFAALYTIAVGAGGLKANVSGLGTDQFDARDPEEEPAAELFFNRFFFCISVGSTVASTALVYVQDRVGRGWGYGAPAAVMVAAAVAFVCGSTKYRYRAPAGSPLTVVGRVLWAAWRNRRVTCPADPSELHGFHAAKVIHTDRLRCLDKAAIVDVNLASSDKALSYPTVTDVEDVKMLAKLLPIWSTCLMFWTVYSQMTTFSVQQASRMDRHIGGGFVVPPGSLSAVLFLTILLFTSLNERLLVPLTRRATGRPQGSTSLQRVGTGLVFAVVAMAAAALVETKRRHAAATGVGVSAFWLVPQFVLVGAGEAFAYVGQLQFFIREAPERMKSLCTGLFLATVAMGFYLSSALVDASPDAWVRDDLDHGRLDLFYWMLAVLGALNFAVFLLFSSQHEYKATAATASAAAAGTENEEPAAEEDAMKIAVVVKMVDV